MLILTDLTQSFDAAALNLAPGLSALLSTFAASLDEALLPWTEFAVIQEGDDERAVVDAIGFSPLVDPIDRLRWPDPAFQPGWDHLSAHACAYQLTFSFGSTYGLIVLVDRTNVSWPALLEMCAAHVAV